MEETKKALVPRRIIETEGSLYYDERAQAWSILRLKSQLSKEFYQLKEKRSKFAYKLTYYQDYEDLDKALKQMKKEGEALPVLLFFYKVKKE
jgi:hypothetical protein